MKFPRGIKMLFLLRKCGHVRAREGSTAMRVPRQSKHGKYFNLQVCVKVCIAEGSPTKLLSGLRIFRKESTKKHRLRACVRELFGRF
jgi:hypothetical protein